MDKNQIKSKYLHMPHNVEWYESLNKSSLTPPPYLISLVFFILYGCILASGFLYFRQTGLILTTGAVTYTIQLILLCCWYPLFFVLKKPWMAAIDGFLLNLCILWTISSFGPICKEAAYLLYPYQAWIVIGFSHNSYIAFKNGEREKVE